MFTKKKIFFYAFSLFFLPFLGYFFVSFLFELLTNISYRTFSSFYGFVESFSLLFLLFVVSLSFLFSLRNYFSKRDFSLVMVFSFFFLLISLFFSFGFELFVFLHSFFFFFFLYLYVLGFLYFKKKSYLFSYFASLFFLLFFGLSLTLYFFSFQSFSSSSYVGGILDFVSENNLLVLDVLNENSKDLLQNHVVGAYEAGFSSGVYTTCLAYKLENCNLSENLSNSSLYVDAYFDRGFEIFDKASYVGAFERKVAEQYPEEELGSFFLLFLLMLMFSLANVFSFLLIFFVLLCSQFVRFFSWLFDPLSLESFSK